MFCGFLQSLKIKFYTVELLKKKLKVIAVSDEKNTEKEKLIRLILSQSVSCIR